MDIFRRKEKLIKSYAKINVALHVTGTREDGYHTLDMVFLPLELHDSIDITIEKFSQQTHVTFDNILLQNLEKNLCKQAVDLMREKYGFEENFRIEVHKVIPFAAGMGGGSSNAAAVMMGINDLLKLNISKEELKELGLKLGADVPYFFDNEPARVSGVGEIIKPFKLSEHYHVLIVKPEQGLSTQSVYKSFGDKKINHPYTIDQTVNALKLGNDELLPNLTDNDLLIPAQEMCPEVGEIIEYLNSQGLNICGMTGSGTACYALSTNQKLIKSVAKKLDDTNLEVFVTKTHHKLEGVKRR